MGKGERNSIYRSAGFMILCLGAAFGGILLREQQSIQEPVFGLDRLVASTGNQPIPEDDYFSELAEILKAHYVDPIGDEMKLATGAVKGMVESLGDLYSLYFDKNEFELLIKSLQGKYEGIGVDLAFIYPTKGANDQSDSIPRVTVLSVVPNGPAAKAGIKPGDWIDSVDGHWVINSLFIDKARDIQQKVQSKQLPQTALDQIRRELRERADKAITPVRAWKRLMAGQNETVTIRVFRGEKMIEMQVAKALSERQKLPNAIRPVFLPGGEKQLASAIAGKNSLRIDLRGMSTGDYRVMADCLGTLGFKGNLGLIVRQDGKPPVPIVAKGNGVKRQIVMIVDGSTRGVAEVFALAAKKGGAKIEGTSANRPVATQLDMLPDGSGYTLNLGTYSAGGAK